MQKLIQHFRGTSEQPRVVPYSSIIVAYQVDSNTWRGFVMPYDITYEAESKKELINVLKNMRDSYVEGLKKYDSPEHLTDVPLSCEEDKQKWSAISAEVMNRLLNNIAKTESSDYYAEAQLPA